MLEIFKRFQSKYCSDHIVGNALDSKYFSPNIVVTLLLTRQKYSPASSVLTEVRFKSNLEKQSRIAPSPSQQQKYRHHHQQNYHHHQHGILITDMLSSSPLFIEDESWIPLAGHASSPCELYKGLLLTLDNHYFIGDDGYNHRIDYHLFSSLFGQHWCL